MTDLSPAARAVWEAFNSKFDWVEDGVPGPQFHSIAAALRAAADQVAPDLPKPSADSDYYLMNWSKSLDQYYQRQQTRAELLAIATELENYQ